MPSSCPSTKLHCNYSPSGVPICQSILHFSVPSYPNKADESFWRETEKALIDCFLIYWFSAMIFSVWCFIKKVTVFFSLTETLQGAHKCNQVVDLCHITYLQLWTTQHFEKGGKKWIVSALKLLKVINVFTPSGYEAIECGNTVSYNDTVMLWKYTVYNTQQILSGSNHPLKEPFSDKLLFNHVNVHMVHIIQDIS